MRVEKSQVWQPCKKKRSWSLVNNLQSEREKIENKKRFLNYIEERKGREGNENWILGWAKIEGKDMASRTGGASRTRVGKYELGRTLGEGSFAKVKFARNTETGENVAIKILDKEKVLKHKMIGQVMIFFFTRLWI